MKKATRITLLTTIAVIAIAFGLRLKLTNAVEEKPLRVGFIFIGDASTAYTENFIKAMENAEHTFGDRIETHAKHNIKEGDELDALNELIEEECELIFTTSYGYGVNTKDFAALHPEVQFCQATCDNANTNPVLENYHTFMGEIYQGRYICGVAAGMKLRQLIDSGRITADQAKIGYVAAFPYAEVISGYTAFFLGARSAAPEAVMDVRYTDTWSNYTREKDAAEKLIEDGCVLISQHSDTRGAAVACEETDPSVPVYHVGYNQSMADIAPTTTITGCKINWTPYVEGAIEAVLDGKKIEEAVKGHVHGNDVGAAFDYGWVEMVDVNENTAAPGTTEKIEELIRQFKAGEVHVFSGDYIGADPFDADDTCDLRTEYIENENASAPSFHYVLRDVITVKEDQENSGL